MNTQMTATIVPLAEMTPATPDTNRALALSLTEDGDATLIVLHDDETTRMVDAAGDALVVLLCGDDHLSCAIDFRRARELIAYEVERARGSVVHLTSLYLYIAQLTNNEGARRLVAKLEDSLGRLGMTARLPDGVQRSEARERRIRATHAADGLRVKPRSKRAVGTRTVSLMFALFGA